MENVTMMMMVGEGLAAIFGVALLYLNHLLKMKRMKKAEKAMIKRVIPAFLNESGKFVDKMMDEIPEKTMNMTKKMMEMETI